jgi:hypothetical protein
MIYEANAAPGPEHNASVILLGIGTGWPSRSSLLTVFGAWFIELADT